MALGIAAPARGSGDEEEERRSEDQCERRQARLAVDRAAAAEDEGEAEHEQEVADDAAGQRPAHDLGEAVGDREEGDDQLGRVPEGCVQEASDSRPRVVRGVLGRLADHPGERDQRRSRDDEEEDVARAGPVEDHDERSHPQQRVQDFPQHAPDPNVDSAVIDAVLFDWGDTLFHFAWDESLVEAGWEAGLAALDREGLPSHDETAARFRERYLPLLWVPGSLDEIEYPAMVSELLEGFGIELSNDDLSRFLEAEHAAWEPARQLGDS